MFHRKFLGDKVYFLGDPHINHKNLVRGTSSWPDKEGCRDFDTVEAHNKGVLDSINDNVSEDGTLLFLGDMCFGDKKYLRTWLSQIVCKDIHLACYGNHDEFIRKDIEYQELFKSCSDYLEIFCSRKSGEFKQINLFHYPLKSWNGVNKGAYALTAHEHGNMPYPETMLALDVGWECFKKPLSFWEVDTILSIREIENRKRNVKVHHNKGQKS